MLNSPIIKWESFEGETQYEASPGSTLSGKTGDALFLFLDESGNFDFGKSGSRYFFMTCVVAKRPLVLNDSLTDMRHELMEKGTCLELFHASEDLDEVRTAVYGLISSGSGMLSAYSIRIDKDAVPDEYHDPAVLYSKVFEYIIREIKEQETDASVKRVVVITDSLPKEAKRRQVEKPLKSFMKTHFERKGIPYVLLHHQSCSSTYLQIADYLSWAVHRLYSKGLDWPMKIVKRCFREIGEVEFSNNKESRPE